MASTSAHVTLLAANENALPAHVHVDGGDAATTGVRSNDAHPNTSGQAEEEPLGSEARSVEGRDGDASSRNVRKSRAHVDAMAQNADAGAAGEHESGRVRSSQSVARRPNATQTIPPALRRIVLVRDEHRCQVPGCRNAVYLDLHHIELRSEGGRNVLESILTLCGAHHRAVHHGSLLIERNPNGEVRFRHGDGTAYAQGPEPKALDVQAKTFSALRGMGFKEAEVRAVLAELRQDDDLRDASVPALLRKALRRIRPLRSKTARS